MNRQLAYMKEGQKRFVASREFWLGVAATFIGLALAIGLYMRFFG